MKKEYDYMNDRWEVYQTERAKAFGWIAFALVVSIGIVGWFGAAYFTAWC